MLHYQQCKIDAGREFIPFWSMFVTKWPKNIKKQLDIAKCKDKMAEPGGGDQSLREGELFR
ncbi:hypothetical protein D7D25_03515 [Proteiniphilum sp. X52]|nr:hypothetical protein D7D25_03515 [Proteiniphilum sp. X52]